jgi:hypothetical protein
MTFLPRDRSSQFPPQHPDESPCSCPGKNIKVTDPFTPMFGLLAGAEFDMLA